MKNFIRILNESPTPIEPSDDAKKIVDILKSYFYHRKITNETSGNPVWHLCSQKEVDVYGNAEKEIEELYEEFDSMAKEIIALTPKDNIKEYIDE